MLAAVIEEAVVVIFVLERRDLLVYKLIEVGKILLQIVWYGEVHLRHD
jgi:hypothetical protein